MYRQTIKDGALQPNAVAIRFSKQDNLLIGFMPQLIFMVMRKYLELLLVLAAFLPAGCEIFVASIKNGEENPIQLSIYGEGSDRLLTVILPPGNTFPFREDRYVIRRIKWTTLDGASFDYKENLPTASRFHLVLRSGVISNSLDPK